MKVGGIASGANQKGAITAYKCDTWRCNVFLVSFMHGGKQYLLYQNGFVGGGYEDAARAIRQNVGKSTCVGGFDKIHVKDMDALKEMVGGTPFPRIDFEGGLGLPFEAVLCTWGKV